MIVHYGFRLVSEDRVHVVTVQGRVNPEKQDEFLQIIRALSGDGGGKKGVSGFRLSEDEEDRTAFSLIHEWETEEDLAKYLGGPKFRVLLGALRILCEQSVIECNSQQIDHYGNRLATRRLVSS